MKAGDVAQHLDALSRSLHVTVRGWPRHMPDGYGIPAARSLIAEISLALDALSEAMKDAPK